MKDQINQVSDTAIMAAAYRAMETNHKNAIFHDPFAAKLAGERGKKIIDSLPKQAFIGGWSVVIRTRIIDDFIRGAIDEGVDTILNLGSGLDTRPYRMELPGLLRWIEVDYPHVIEQKETCLSVETPRCRLERVKLDLADVDARRALLDEVATQSKKILVLTEAVTPYLSADAVASLGMDLRSKIGIGSQGSTLNPLVICCFAPDNKREKQAPKQKIKFFIRLLLTRDPVVIFKRDKNGKKTKALRG